MGGGLIQYSLKYLMSDQKCKYMLTTVMMKVKDK